MKKPLVVANWKATKTIKESLVWAKELKTSLEEVSWAEIIVCPPFTSLPILRSFFQDTSVKIGAQTVSSFEQGPFTGEVTADMLEGLADFCIVGHSERRKNFGESNDEINDKIRLLTKVKIKPIVCVSNLEEVKWLSKVKDLIDIIAYEPLFAIGSDNPDTPENAAKIASLIRENLGKRVNVIYGGSVDAGNVFKFTQNKELDGVLPGRASWEPRTFLNLLNSIRLGGVVN